MTVLGIFLTLVLILIGYLVGYSNGIERSAEICDLCHAEDIAATLRTLK